MSFFVDHYNKKFLIKSKYLTSTYNLTPWDIKNSQIKLKKQIDYLQNTYVDSINDGDDQISLLDFSYGSNIRPEIYIAELRNRVDTLKKFALQNGYDCPIFLTITPATHFKPLKTVRLKNKDYDLMVDNKNFSGDFDNYTNDCRIDIGYHWTKLQRDRLFSDIKKSHGQSPIYFSTWEPYIDGSLHKHILMFIPSQYKQRMLNRITYHIQARNHDVKFVSNDETNIDQSISYILKYVTKTFTHSKTEEISLETLFYVKHSLRRFTTSRTLAPLFLYRLSRREIDYLSFTHQYKNNQLYIEAMRHYETKRMKITRIVSIDGYDQTSYLYQRPETNVFQSDKKCVAGI